MFNKNVSTLAFIKTADTPEFLKSLFSFLDRHFLCSERGSSVGVELMCGVVSFASCMFLLAVIPHIMAAGGYDISRSSAVVSLVMGVGNIVSGVVSNLPIILGPSTPVSAYFVSSIQAGRLSVHQANMIVVYLGIAFVILGVVNPVGRFFARTIPEYIQVSTSIGIGLISTLTGFSQLGLVKQGRYSALELGTLDAQSIIGVSTILVIAISTIMNSKIAHIRGLVWGTIVWWASQNTWPEQWTTVPFLQADRWTTANNPAQISLVFEMFFLLLLSVFGLCKSLCTLSGIMTKEGMVPNGRYLTQTVAVMNILSGSLGGLPISVIADSAAGVRAGSKTGLSSVVAGILFILAIFFGPLYAAIPPTGYSPILIMTGIVQFKNIQSLDFNSRFAVPAFMCFTLIPFTNSIFAGLGIGMTCYVLLSLLTGQFLIDGKEILAYYFPATFDSKNTTSGSDNSGNDGTSEADDKASEIKGKVELRIQTNEEIESTGIHGTAMRPNPPTPQASPRSFNEFARARRNSFFVTEMTTSELDGDMKGLVV
jgi:AGZA family xanthine/uracil permease-like MFS transporter